MAMMNPASQATSLGSQLSLSAGGLSSQLVSQLDLRSSRCHRNALSIAALHFWLDPRHISVMLQIFPSRATAPTFLSSLTSQSISALESTFSLLNSMYSRSLMEVATCTLLQSNACLESRSWIKRVFHAFLEMSSCVSTTPSSTTITSVLDLPRLSTDLFFSQL